jgi:CheY-like chemotaxis protein
MPLTGETRKTLFVDDDEMIRDVMVEVLRELGLDVVEAGTGTQALALIDDSFDLLITDIRLPDMFGNQLAVKIRQRFPQLPVIFATGGDGSMPHASETVDDAILLLKPYDLSSFKNALGKAGFVES